MGKKTSIFTTASDTKVQVNFKIEKSLKEDIELVENKLKKIDPTLKFDKNAIATKALKEAVSRALKELEEKPKEEEGVV